MSSSLSAKLESFATNASYSDIRRKTAKLGEYFQASIRIVTAYLSPDLRKYQHAISVEQVSLKFILITYFKDAR